MNETKKSPRKYEESLSTAIWGSLGFGLGAISLPLILNVFCSLLSIAAESGSCLVKLSAQTGTDLPYLASVPGNMIYRGRSEDQPFWSW